MAIAKKNGGDKSQRNKASAAGKKAASIRLAAEKDLEKRPVKSKKICDSRPATKKAASRGKASGDKLEPGTVIGVSRGLYKHYAIYAGRNIVIHYASSTGDFGDELRVRKTSVKNFLADASEFFVCEFPDAHGKPRETKRDSNLFNSITSFFGGGGLTGNPENPMAAIIDIYKLFKRMNYKLYSPAETLRRAKDRLGESSYSLFFNNCEHFVVWCKTGVSESHQVNEIIEAIAGGR